MSRLSSRRKKRRLRSTRKAWNGRSLWFETLECRRLLASVSGTLFEDIDSDGSQGADEAGLVGRTVYLDANNNRKLDAVELSQTTDQDGHYLFPDVDDGIYVVRQQLIPNWQQTFPSLNGVGAIVLFETLGEIETQPPGGTQTVSKPTAVTTTQQSQAEVVSSAGDSVDKPALLTGISSDAGAPAAATMTVAVPVSLDADLIFIDWNALVTDLPVSADHGAEIELLYKDLSGAANSLLYRYEIDGHLYRVDSTGQTDLGTYTPDEADQFDLLIEQHDSGGEPLPGAAGGIANIELVFRSFVNAGAIGTAPPLAVDDITVFSSFVNFPKTVGYTIELDAGEAVQDLDFGSQPPFLGFISLNDIENGIVDVAAFDVSGDGSTVVGAASFGPFFGDDYAAMRWTLDDGIVRLDSSGTFTEATGVSEDGGVIVYDDDFTPFRWTEATGGQFLGIPPLEYIDWEIERANAVSADGSQIVGVMTNFPDSQAFRLTWSSGGFDALGDLAGGDFASEAFAISADGSVVVGSSQSAAGREAFRWTETAGIEGLGDLSGGPFDSETLGISADGTTIVGVSQSALGPEAFIWTASSGMQPLGFLTGASDSKAYDVSANGAIVVGESGNRAFIWDAISGMRDLEDVMNGLFGTDVGTLRAATAISDDGLVVVGSRADGAWRADLSVDAVDLLPTALDFNAAMGGMDFQYEIRGADLDTPSTIALYWSDGSDSLGAPVFEQPTATAAGSYGPVHVDESLFQNRPATARAVRLVIDPGGGGGSVPESNEANNAIQRTVQQPDLFPSTIEWNTVSGGVDFSYEIASSFPIEASTVAVFWAAGTTLEDAIGAAIIEQNTATDPGSHGPFNIPASLFDSPPLGSSHVIVVTDRADSIAEQNENNNLLALALPDLAATSFTWNDNDGGIDITYEVRQESLPTASTVAVFWADGSTLADVIGNAVYQRDTETAVGSYGPIEIDRAALGLPPAGATHLLLAVDPDNSLAESSELNNTQALTLPDLVATSIEINTTLGGVDLNFDISNATLQVPATVAAYWASGSTIGDVIGQPILQRPVTKTDQGSYVIRVPQLLVENPPPQAQYLLMVADDADTVVESSENNNVQALLWDTTTPTLGIDRWWATTSEPPIDVTWTFEVGMSDDYLFVIDGLNEWGLTAGASAQVDGQVPIPFAGGTSIDIMSLDVGIHEIVIAGLAVPQDPVVEEIEFQLFRDVAGLPDKEAHLAALFVADQPEIYESMTYTVVTSEGNKTLSNADELIDEFAPILHFSRDEQSGETERYAMPFDVLESLTADAIVPPSDRYVGNGSQDNWLDLSVLSTGQPWPRPGDKPRMYASVIDDPGLQRLAVSYWFHYPRSNWAEHGGFNTHEGDWEGVTLFFIYDHDSGAWRPFELAMAQHEKFVGSFVPDDDRIDGGDKVAWNDLYRAQSRPHLFVGLGGHATYAHRDTTEYLTVDLLDPIKDEIHLGDGIIENANGTYTVQSIVSTDDQVDYLPRVDAVGPASTLDWLRYPSRWGNPDLDGDSLLDGDGGPRGPVFSADGFGLNRGERWYDPWSWSLDFNYWVPPADVGVPQATLIKPAGSSQILDSVINDREYIDVTYSDIGPSGLFHATIEDVDPEFTLSGPAAANVVIDGAPALINVFRDPMAPVSETEYTYRYHFSGKFTPGEVTLDFIADSWTDLEGIGNTATSEIFTVLPHEAVNVVEIIDRSGSMNGQKLADAQNAASVFAQLMRTGDRLGVVTFADDAATDFQLTALDDISLADALDAIATLDASGSTSIGEGIVEADLSLDVISTDQSRSMILLSDGRHNAGIDPLAALDQVDDDIRIFTIAFGSDADVELLTEIATATGGQFFPSDDGVHLQQIYTTLVGLVGGQQPVVNMNGAIDQDETINSTAIVDAGARSVTIGANWPGSDLDLELEDPLGNVITHATAGIDPQVQLVEEATYEFFRIENPSAGQWQIRVAGVDVPEEDYPFNLFALVDSDINISANSDRASYFGRQYASYQLTLDQDGTPIPGATVTADVTLPDDSIVSFTLFDDGTHGDGAADDGVYGARFGPLLQIGNYETTIVATGVNPTAFQRTSTIVYNVTENPNPEDLQFVVNTQEDTVDNIPGNALAADAAGNTSLRAAIMETNALPGHDTIILPPGNYALTLGVAGEDLAETGDLDIVGDLTIRGSGADKTFIDAADLDRVFDIFSGVQVHLCGVTIAGGHATGGESGGGIRNAGELTLSYSAVAGNQADGTGGGLANTGTATITHSTFSGNMASGNGGGLFNADAADATIDNSTFSGNEASGDGGGIFNDTLGMLDIARSTVAENIATVGGGIASAGGTVAITGTLVANNGGSGSNVDVSGTFASAGYNLIGVAESGNGFTPDDLIGTAAEPLDPLLGPLQDNGGGTQTHELLPGSPAINAGLHLSLDPTALITDQRGAPRNLNGEIIVDIGAFQSGLQAFFVDSLLDATDAVPGDGQSDDGFGNSTLRAAVMEANAHNGDDVIVVGIGTFRLSIPGTNESLSLTGDLDIRDQTGSLTIIGAGTAKTTIDAAGIDRVFDVFGGADLRLHQLKITGGKLTEADDDGGGVRNNTGATLRVEHTLIQGNTTADDGGGISNRGSLTTNGSTISENTATDNGGGIYNVAAGTLTIIDTTINENVADDGGAFYNSTTSQVIVSQSEILRNTATDEGGALFNASIGPFSLIDSELSDNTALIGGGLYNLSSSGDVTVDKTVFFHNNGLYLGGGIFNVASVLSITDSYFDRNTAGGPDKTGFNKSGGAIYNTSSGDIDLLSSSLTQNSANDNGGAIYNSNGNVLVHNSLIEANSTGNDGGAIYNTSAGYIELTATSVLQNVATDDGGAIYISSGNLLIEDSHVDGNWAGDYGGGVYSAGDTTIFNSVVSVNTSGTSGGGIANFSGTLAFDKSLLSGNTSANGGGIYARYSDVSVRGSMVTGNSSEFVGGGLLNQVSLSKDPPDSSTVFVEESIFHDNLSEGDGGAIGNVRGSVTLRRTEFFQNTAEDDGGALYSTLGLMELFEVSVHGNAALDDGGGIYTLNSLFTVFDSAFFGNTAGDDGGGIRNLIQHGGAADLMLTNTTISANTAGDNGGGIYSGIGATTTLVNTTIYQNHAQDEGGGVFRDVDSVVDMGNTIVALNSDAAGNPDVSGTFVSDGHNLIGNLGRASGFTNNLNGDQVGAAGDEIDPLLGPLQDNGGLTFTHAPLAGSTAIDRGDDALAPATDQRGVNRSQDGDATPGQNVDIGAVEVFLDAADIQIDVRVVPVAAASDSDAVELPTADTSFLEDEPYYVELWAQGTGFPGGGVGQGFVDIGYDTEVTDAVAVVNDPFDMSPDAVINDPLGTVENLGGATFVSNLGAAPDWTRIGYVQFQSTGPGDVVFDLAAGQLPFRSFSVGDLDWSQIDLSDLATVTIVAVNDAPSFVKGEDQTVVEDAGPQSVPGWATVISAGPPDESEQLLTFNVTGNSNPGLFAVPPAVSPDGTLTFTPADDAFGSATITVELQDDGGTDNGGDDTSDPQTFNISVEREVDLQVSTSESADPVVAGSGSGNLTTS